MAVTLLLPGGAARADDLPPPCPPGAIPPFEDVTEFRTHARAIGCLAALEVTGGIRAGFYGYDRTLEHGQLATLLVRALDVAEGLPHPLPYPFRPWYSGTSTHALAINRLYEAEILPDLDGYDPTATVTRSQMASVVAGALVFAQVLPATADEEVFNDLQDEPAADAIHRLGAVRVVNGTADGRFQPDLEVNRAQMATFVANLLALTSNGGQALPPPLPPPPPPPPSEPDPPPPPVLATPEGWLLAGGRGEVVGSVGTLVRYTVELGSALQSRQDVTALAERVEAVLSEPDRGWTARGRHRLQRVDDPARARIRILLTTPAHVDRLCGQVGLRTAGIYSCWTGRFVALNADRWFTGVAHISDLELYRDYLINHEVGHGLGYGHVSCPGTGRLAPVMVQQSMRDRLGSCRPNGWPYP